MKTNICVVLVVAMLCTGCASSRYQKNHPLATPHAQKSLKRMGVKQTEPNTLENAGKAVIGIAATPVCVALALPVLAVAGYKDGKNNAGFARKLEEKNKRETANAHVIPETRFE